MLGVEVTPQQLDDLRSLLIIGMAFQVYLLVLLNTERKPQEPPKRTPPVAVYCPLHRKARHLCEDQHDPEP